MFEIRFDKFSVSSGLVGRDGSRFQSRSFLTFFELLLTAEFLLFLLATRSSDLITPEAKSLSYPSESSSSELVSVIGISSGGS